jgi:glycerol-3-phosphate acyltransferase PlsY
MARNVIGTSLSMGLCGMATIIGHVFPIYVGFNGGKGVATTTGVIFGINSIIGWLIYPIWIIFVLLTDRFILSSLLCMLIIPGLMFIFGQSPVFISFGFIYLLIGMFSHKNDILKIISGSEKSARGLIKKYIK